MTYHCSCEAELELERPSGRRGALFSCPDREDHAQYLWELTLADGLLVPCVRGDVALDTGGGSAQRRSRIAAVIS